MNNRSSSALPSGVQACPACGSDIAPGLLSCPSCHRLVHADRLKLLAEAAETAFDPAAALVAWREALALLPPQTRQYNVISDKIARLGRADRVGTGSDRTHPQQCRRPSTPGDDQATAGWSKGAATGAIGTLALMLWKFKFLAFMVLSKGKLLLLGLTKASTFLSMFATVGVYWTAFGFRFALGFVLSIYIHEMGHVAALRAMELLPARRCSYLAWERSSAPSRHLQTRVKRRGWPWPARSGGWARHSSAPWCTQ